MRVQRMHRAHYEFFLFQVVDDRIHGLRRHKASARELGAGNARAILKHQECCVLRYGQSEWPKGTVLCTHQRLLDVLDLSIHPVLVGHGKPFFREGKP
jgi:hypothetical protein